jgi:hypothetical protein
MKRSLELFALAITVSFTPPYSITIIPVTYIIIITIIITEQTANFYVLYCRLLMIENVALTVNGRGLST